jgi:hypothetical protein
MPFAFEDPIHDTSTQGKANATRPGSQIPTAILDALAPEARATAMQFDNLLGSAPADLAQISDEIRSHPMLEGLVMRYLALLAISPGDSAGTIEEATIVLGTNRLRALVSVWLLNQERGTAEEVAAESRIAPTSDSTNVMPGAPESTWTPEMLYLASLMPLLGLNLDAPTERRASGSIVDTQDQKDRVRGLVELLGADFISLNPIPNSSALAPVGRLTPASDIKPRRKCP